MNIRDSSSQKNRVDIRVQCGHFFINQDRSSNQRSGIVLEVQIQNFGACFCAPRHCMHFKVFIFKNLRGPTRTYKYFVAKIGMKLPFTFKNKRKFEI